MRQDGAREIPIGRGGWFLVGERDGWKSGYRLLRLLPAGGGAGGETEDGWAIFRGDLTGEKKAGGGPGAPSPSSARLSTGFRCRYDTNLAAT